MTSSIVQSYAEPSQLEDVCQFFTALYFPLAHDHMAFNHNYVAVVPVTLSPLQWYITTKQFRSSGLDHMLEPE